MYGPYNYCVLRITYHAAPYTIRNSRASDILPQPTALPRDEFDRRVVGRVEAGGLVGVGQQRGPADQPQAQTEYERHGAYYLAHCRISSLDCNRHQQSISWYGRLAYG